MAAYIVAAKRTPFGAFGGKLKDFSATTLGVLATNAALNQLPKGIPVDSVIFGNVIQSSTDAAYLARHVALYSGLPQSTSAMTINRLCGSGFQSVVSAVHEIKAGDADIVIAGGAENMSQAPFAARNVRWGVKYGADIKLEDTLAHGLIDQYNKPTPMAITAENLAAKYNISRADCEAFALESQQRYTQGKHCNVVSSLRFLTLFPP
jgi:acetyl-CoA acyltransferase 2